MNIGPMQLVVVGFDGDVMESDVLDELLAASVAGAVRLVDVLVAEKDEDGEAWISEIVDLTFEEEMQYGTLTGALIELDVDGGGEAAASLSHYVLGLTPGEVNELVHSLPKGHSGLVALFENSWARDLHEATLNAGGVILAQALIEPRNLLSLSEELEAALGAAAVVEAAEMTFLAEDIAEEAAQQAVAALVAADLVEEAAAERATAAVKAAWVLEE